MTDKPKLKEANKNGYLDTIDISALDAYNASDDQPILPTDSTEELGSVQELPEGKTMGGDSSEVANVAPEASQTAETKSDKFKRIANLRVNNALKSIRLISNLSRKSDYEYTDKQIGTILAALNDEIADMAGEFYNNAEEKRRISL